MNRLPVKAVIRSLLLSYISAAILLTVLAFLLYRMHLGEGQIALGVNAIYILTCFIGGFAAGRSVGQRRFFWGLLTGVLYFCILLAVSCGLHKGFSGDIPSVVQTFIMCAGGGMLGGMFS